MNTAVMAPAFEELSADLRYQLLRRWQRRDWAITVSSLVTTVALLLPMMVPVLNERADAVIAALRNPEVADTVLNPGGLMSSDFAMPVREGEQIAGYRVTSGYGLRDTTTLPAGASADHKGVDIATPEGTKIYAIGQEGTRTKVRCWKDVDGGGLVADMESTGLPNWRFQALHLSHCKTGLYDAGTVIATTGATGIGAAHLDWRQRDKVTGIHQHPQTHYLLWALTGSNPLATLSDIDILRTAIIGQESAGDAVIVNNDSGALGLGQVMPENLAEVDAEGNPLPRSGWDYEALGEDLTVEEFLASPEKQTRIINHQLAKIYQQQKAEGHSDDEAIKRTAAEWYSGQPHKVDDPTPQPWHNLETGKITDYPSVGAYSEKVLGRVNLLRNRGR